MQRVGLIGAAAAAVKQTHGEYIPMLQGPWHIRCTIKAPRGLYVRKTMTKGGVHFAIPGDGFRALVFQPLATLMHFKSKND